MVASVGGLFEIKTSEYKAMNENTQSKNESAVDKGTDDSDSSLEKSPIVINNAGQHSAALLSTCSSNNISSGSMSQEKIHACDESTCLTLESPDSLSSVMHGSSQNADSDSFSTTDGNNSISGNLSQELPSPEIAFHTLLNSKEDPPNIFFPKGKIYEQNFQACEVVENTGELDTNVLTPTPDERREWVKMNNKYLQKEGYRLGVNPGTFYSSKAGYFVEVPNGINYEIILTNENPVPCNVDVLIDNSPIPVICFRLNPGKPVRFDGPTFCENKFVFLRSKDAPSQSGINPEDTNSGVIQAIFTPQKVETLRNRTLSEPVAFSRSLTNALEMLGIEQKARKFRSYTSSCAGAERGIDIRNFCQGGTALRGEQTTKTFKKADSMEVDETRRVIVRLRLVARIDDPSVPSEEDICSMFPPTVEELLSS